jgi:hypothetical protein
LKLEIKSLIQNQPSGEFHSVKQLKFKIKNSRRAHDKTKIIFPLLLFFFLSIFFSARAASSYTLELPLTSGSNTVQGPAEYFRMFFIYGLSLVGAAALFAFVYGGIRYMVSGSSQTGKTEGKNWITGAIAGLALLFCSWLILYTINPALISFKEPNLPTIEINVPEPPTQTILNYGSQTGTLPSSLTFSNSKYPDMEQRFNNTAPNNLRQVVAGLPLPSVITSYDQGTGHKTNSDHYQQKAVDIYIGNMTNDQVRTLMTYLNSNPNVSKTINGRLPELNYYNGKPHNYETNDPGINKNHATHIHVSVY